MPSSWARPNGLDGLRQATIGLFDAALGKQVDPFRIPGAHRMIANSPMLRSQASFGIYRPELCVNGFLPVSLLASHQRNAPRLTRALRRTSRLRGKGFALRPVSPTFGRCAPCKPGDTPPAFAPSARKAPRRHGSHRGANSGGLRAKEKDHEQQTDPHRLYRDRREGRQ